MVHRKLRLAVFAADMAEAVFNEYPGGGTMQYIHHVDMTARERPINPGRLQDVQLVGSSDVNPTFPVGGHFSDGGTHYHHRRQRALTEVVGKVTFAPQRVKGADRFVGGTRNPA